MSTTLHRGESYLAHPHLSLLIQAPNPFTNTYVWTLYNIAKAAVCIIFLLPLRLSLLVMSILTIVTFGLPAGYLIPSGDAAMHKPLPPLAFVLAIPVRFALRILLFALGYWWISVKDERRSKCKPARIIVANHTSLMDALILGYHFFPSAVAKDSLAKLPVLNILGRVTQTIFVRRQDPNSRTATRNAILARVQAEGAQPLLIFPEGTCTNGKCLITFKHGAFLPAAPVLPVVIRYPHRHFNPSKAGRAGRNPFLFLLQFTNFVEVNILDTYIPNDAERASPDLFASNVRELFKAKLGVPTTRHSYDDVFLAALALKSGIEQNFEAEVVEKLSGMSSTDLEQLMKRFVACSKGHQGPNQTPVLTFPDYCEFVKSTENSIRSRQMFSFFDYTESGKIAFTEVISGLALLSADSPFPFDDRAALAFRMYDLRGAGRLQLQDIFEVAQGEQSFPAETRAALQESADSQGTVGYRKFFALAQKHPIVVTRPLELAKGRVLSILRGEGHPPSPLLKEEAAPSTR